MRFMQSLTTIVHHYYPVITRLARYLIKNERVAETIPATVFSQLQPSLPDIRTKKQLHQYLLTATRMACHAWLHQQALVTKSNTESKQHHSNNDSVQSPLSKGEGVGGEAKKINH